MTGSPPGNNVCAGLASRLGVGSQARVLPGLPNNVRATPSTSAALVGTLPGGSVFSVTGGPTCAEGILWWQIYANGLVGWTGEGQGGAYWVEPVGSTSYGTATVTAYYLNVRSAPNAFASILTRIARGETYNVVGRNAVSSWLQLNVNGVIGWVNARYVSAINLGSVPVTG